MSWVPFSTLPQRGNRLEGIPPLAVLTLIEWWYVTISSIDFRREICFWAYMMATMRSDFRPGATTSLLNHTHAFVVRSAGHRHVYSALGHRSDNPAGQGLQGTRLYCADCVFGYIADCYHWCGRCHILKERQLIYTPLSAWYFIHCYLIWVLSEW